MYIINISTFSQKQVNNTVLNKINTILNFYQLNDMKYMVVKKLKYNELNIFMQ